MAEDSIIPPCDKTHYKCTEEKLLKCARLTENAPNKQQFVILKQKYKSESLLKQQPGV